MADEIPRKVLLRRALSAHTGPRRAALTAISLCQDGPPPSFIPYLLGRAPVIDQRSLQLTVRIVAKSISKHGDAHARKKLAALAASARKAPLPTRDALNFSKMAAALVGMSPPDVALELLIVCVAAIESSVTPASGPQRRSKSKALQAAYRHGGTAVLASLPSAKPALLSAAERYGKAPYEAVAALGLLAPSFEQLEAVEQERFLVLVGTVCMKATKVAEHVVRSCAEPLANANPNIVLGKVVPIIDRALLREPEAALPAATHFFRGTTIVDYSSVAAKSLIPAVLQAVKSAEEKTRVQGVSLINALGTCMCDEKAVLDAVAALIAVLKGARYAYQKVATVDSISALTCASACSQTVFEFAIEELLTWLSSKKESNEEARLSGIRALVSMFSLALAGVESNRLADPVQKCATFFSDVLTGKFSDSDTMALLTALTDGFPDFPLSKGMSETLAVPGLQSLVTRASTKSKQEECLRALTVLADWDSASHDRPVIDRNSKAWAVYGVSDSSPVLQDASSFANISEARCAIRCCSWMVHVDHEASDLALRTLYRLAVDSRTAVSRAALDEILKTHKSGKRDASSKMFSALWQTHFCASEGSTSVAKSYEFCDGMLFAERLGHALLATVLPNIPLDYIPFILLAANHPRLVPQMSAGRSPPQSRYWSAIESKLERVDPDYAADIEEDWLERGLGAIFGEEGLLSEYPASVTAGVNSLRALADRRNYYSTRVLRRTVHLLRPLVSGAARLGPEDFEALEIVRQAKEMSKSGKDSAEGSRGVQKKSVKRQTGSSNPRLSQQKQAEADRARAAAANASAAAEKAKAAQERATVALSALRLSQSALSAISALTLIASEGVHSLMAAMLSLVLPLAKLEVLERPCRDAVSALSEISNPRLRGMSVDISSCLYGLERGVDVQATVSRVIYALKDVIPPAFGAEDFSLVSPIIRAALLRDPDAEDRGIMSGKRGSTKRRDAIAVVKAAAQVLVEHCRPEAVDAAVAAAGCRAGSWAVRVLEREDGAFAAAADGLALLTGTALNPGTESLSQVLEGIISGKSSVRDAALAALGRVPPLSSPNIECPRDPTLGRSLWLARFDPDEANAELAEELWGNYKHPLFVPEDVPAMLGLLAHREADIRLMSAKAIALALYGKENEPTRNLCIPQMFTLYLKRMPVRSVDENGARSGREKVVPPPVRRGRERSNMEVDEDPDEGWVAREGVALAIESMAVCNSLTLQDIGVSFSFLAGRGLGDGNDLVRAKMSKAATAVVEAAGTHGPAILLPMIEKQLNTKFSSTASKDEVLHADRTRENLVMCLGSVASFLPKDDSRVEKIANQVIKSAMETPSEVVQNAAARCLVPLAAAAIGGAREQETIKSLLGTVWNATSTYGERRGAAYAIAGICRGFGLKFMTRSHIMSEIEAAVAEKDPRRRQGAFLLIETHAILLERLFEPYTITIVPFLLQCMGDSVVEVRNACWAAAQASMSEISSLGVKMILPSLLEGLKDRQWRTKAGSAEVLGAMAYCAPRQLAQCLPQVVPKLAEALADAHPKVVSSAEAAINRIAAVVRSPEVRKLSPFLLAALRDPAGRTRGAVDAMLGSEFVHAIDAASLALLIPPLHRGLRDRSSELKKRSAAIVGSMCNNVANHSDVVPYLDLLLPSLRVTLLDAIPDVRRTSARALGALAVSLGEQGLPDIVSWLVNALLGGGRSSVGGAGERPRVPAAVISSSAERSGAAMGLAEVSASMSERRLEDVLNSVLLAGQSSAEAREGGLMLIAAMPRALGERFENRLGRALSAILQGLADDADSVREAALEAGRNLVSAYAKSSLDHLLPELLTAMREKLWRIRQAATRLLGDMLLVIAGATPERPDIFGATDTAGNDAEVGEEGSDRDGEGEGEESEQDDEQEEEDEQYESPEQAAAAMTTEAAMKVIEEVLGFDRRNEVLAALYIIRCDVSVRVRQTGMQVWKSVVANTPRVLREIMPSAVRQIVDGLGDEDEERRAAAGKTLSDLSQKLGDRVVPEVLPALKAGIANKESTARIRRGACEGLGELVLASPKEQLADHALDLVDAVYTGLTDELASVREIAAEVFASLLKPLGTFAVDAIVPKLISGLSGDSEELLDAEIALDSLKQILRSSGTRLMAIVVPRLLTERPLKTSGARALATAAHVAENGFEPYIVDVTTAVVESLEVLDTSDPVEPLESILAAVAEGGEQSVKSILDEIFVKFNEGYPERRIAASRTCAGFCRSASLERVVSSAVPLLEVLIRQLADTDEDAARAAWEALKVLTDTVPSGHMSRHIPIIRQSLRSASTGITVTDSDARITGLQIPKAPAPFVPILSDGLLNGAAELREQAALAIGELVELTNAKSLGPFVIKFAGPLIRVVSGRFQWQVKAAILKALLLLLKKGSPMLRTFAPQLQSTFVKSLSDNSRLVRVRACAALGALIPIQTRLEPLLNDLVSLGISGSTPGSRAAAFHSCSQVFRLGKKLPESAFTSIPETISEALSDEDGEVTKAAGRALGFLAGRSGDVSQYMAILDMVHSRLGMEDAEYSDRVSAVRAMGEIFAAGRSVKGLQYEHVEKCASDVFELFSSAVSHLQCAACATAADLFMLLSEIEGVNHDGAQQKNEVVLKLSERAEFDERPDVRVAALNALKSIVRADDIVLELSSAALVVCAAATNTGIRDSADRALRRAFLKGKDMEVDMAKVQLAKENLEEEDQRFIDRRLPKLRTLPESDEERE